MYLSHSGSCCSASTQCLSSKVSGRSVILSFVKIAVFVFTLDLFRNVHTRVYFQLLRHENTFASENSKKNVKTKHYLFDKSLSICSRCSVFTAAARGYFGFNLSFTLGCSHNDVWTINRSASLIPPCSRHPLKHVSI